MFHIGSTSIDYTNPVNVSSPLNKGLVAWWMGLPGGGKGNTLFDLTGSHHATKIGPAWSGRERQAVSLWHDGADDYSTVPSGVENRLTASGEASIVIWLKLRNATPATGGATGFVRFTSTATSTRSSHYPYTDGVGYFSTLSTLRNTVTLSAAVTRTNWHQVAITAKSGTNNWVAYQNGTAVGTASNGSSALDEANGIWIGRSDNPGASGGPFYMHGWVASVRLYDRALSTSEVSRVWLETRHGWPTALSRNKKYWIGTAGAAPSFKAAWASQRSQIIGGGFR